MIHTIILLIICCLGVLFYKNGASYEKNKRFIVCSLAIIFFVEALRGENVGLDTLNYVRGFYDIISNPEQAIANSKWEKLWVILNVLVGTIGKNSQLIIATAALIILVGFGLFFFHSLEENESAFWPVFFFIALGHYFNSMNLLRQYCAMAVAVNIYTILQKEISKKSIINSLILLTIGFFFHSTAILYSVLVLIYFIPIRRRTIVSALITCAIALTSFQICLRIFVYYFPRYARYIAQISDIGKYGGLSFGGYAIILTTVKIVAIGLVAQLNPDKEDNKPLYRMILIIVISIGGWMLGTRTQLAGRMTYYFDFFLVIFIPKLINRMKGKRITLYSMVFVFGWLVWMYLLLDDNGIGTKGCVPYYFFWQQQMR